MGTQEEGERLRAIRLAEGILYEFRTERKSEYKKREPDLAKCLPPGTFVSIRVLNPKKGETHWQPGYQVLSSYNGALRVMELSTGNIVRINQRNVREIPESKPYDEVDPIPSGNPRVFDLIRSEAEPVPIVNESYLPTHLPASNAQLKCTTWWYSALELSGVIVLTATFNMIYLCWVESCV